jgi:hypothetical protein
MTTVIGGKAQSLKPCNARRTTASRVMGPIRWSAQHGPRDTTTVPYLVIAPAVLIIQPEKSCK